MKQLWVLVGGNGSGKTTFYETILKQHGLPFISADLIAREVFPQDPEGNSYEAARLAEMMRERHIQQGTSFCYETVFSHPSKIDFLARAKAKGYEIVLIVIHVGSTGLNLARIRQRVEEGGHNVPSDKVKTRIPRTLNNVKKAIPLCDDVRVLDNASLDTPFQEVLTIRQGVITAHIDPLPDWVRGLL
ncbi:AAA family ATPase [Thalassospira australica]|uniref:AAA family ATPase n=1 Tax=Thalassospira australica TaxID=1528106 RepID=UPI000519F445|nr:AAA family ATPase [Thalassospira australica]